MNNRRPVLLGGYAAKQCARRIHNEWDPTVVAELVAVPADLEARLAQGRAFEDAVRSQLEAALGEHLVLIDCQMRRDDAIATTVEFMRDGAAVIFGAWLPDDVDGGRKGRPDLLLRVSPAADQPQYVAGDIKAHATTKPAARGQWLYSTLSAPNQVMSEPGRAARISDRYDDYVQLAHYARMLQAAGFAPADGSLRGFIIGTDAAPHAAHGQPALTWLDLRVPLFTTFSRSGGTAQRSAIERYDHEHSFRLKVARRAASRTGAAADLAPLVEPIATDECEICPWRQYCRDLMGPHAASSVLQAGRLDVREWRALTGLGILTAQDLSELDLTDEAFWETYLPEVTHQAHARGRLAMAVTRAQMALAGVTLQRKTIGKIDLPRFDVEIDFDIEWDVTDRVFLWGALVTDATYPAGRYVHFSTLDSLDDASERALGGEFLAWLRDQVAQAEAGARSLAVYHYAHPETSHLVRVFGREQVADLLPRFVDLLGVVREHYIGAAGLSIKQVAPVFGFHWRDKDPGGLQAQTWLARARQAGSEQRQALLERLLAYNEDDVRATAVVRAGIRQESASGTLSLLGPA